MRKFFCRFYFNQLRISIAGMIVTICVALSKKLANA